MSQILAALLISMSGMPQAAGQAPRDSFTQRITEELRRLSRPAADLFTQGNIAADSQHWQLAESRYREVLRRVPTFFHAQRRLCNTVLEEGRRDEAVALCKDAYVQAATRENRMALANALVTVTAGHDTVAQDLVEAVNHAETVLSEGSSQDHYVYYTACRVALAAGSLHLLRRCSEGLDSVAPTELSTQYFGWLTAVNDSRFDEADRRLELARGAGLDPAEYVRLKKATADARPWWPRVARLSLIVAGVWLSGLLLLLGIGAVLSQTTLRAVRRVPAQRTGASSGLEAALRRTYRTVLWLCCAYYYVSVPLVLVAVVLGGAGLVYAFFAIGHIPIKLIVIVVGGVLVTVYAALKSLFIRDRIEDPGARLDETAHPRLRALLNQVAAEVGTRPVDTVYLTPGTEVAVMERGGMLGQLRGNAERCLILGVAALEGMELGPFRAVLAHEYGHFSNRDTAGGGFALAVRRSLFGMAQGLVDGDAASWFNPAWIFLTNFHRVFLRISQGASRLQEVLADRWAAFIYGAEQFERGLRHIIERSVRFQAHANATIQEVLEVKRPLTNLYAYMPSKLPSDAEIARAVEEAIGKAPSPYDSHPAPRDRFTWVHGLDAPARELPDNHESAWVLFGDRTQLEMAMTTQVRANIEAHHGVRIPG